ncbi:MAG: hypothetical protein JNJ73_13240 [Hyphomonadaceae bacterium]|nr:hypothetical protein [Hyphomonadaceae bacterium]
MSLSRIVLRLARNPDAGIAEGDDSHGYTLVAPLSDTGLLDEDAWRAHKDECSVRAFSSDGSVRLGRLARRGNNWFFDYDRAASEDDEPIFKLDSHKFISGEYITVKDTADEPLVYRVSEVQVLR